MTPTQSSDSTTAGSDLLIARAEAHGARRAVLGPGGEFSYLDLLERSARTAAALLDGARDLDHRRVAFAVAPGFDYVSWQWGIWRAGGVAVPLCVSHPPPELEYVIEDSDCTAVIADPDREAVLRPLAGAAGRRFVSTAEVLPAAAKSLPGLDPERRAMIIYTSGTTGRPKGVVSTHRVIAAQIRSLVHAWEWTAEDHIVSVLPLHHIHGIVNVLGCALWSGAACELLPRFEPAEVWERLADASVFMAVPTIYSRLIRAWEQAPAATRARWSEHAAALRLTVSGSAALPVLLFERWREISGQALLERYGMSEIGMALSNPLNGERVAGSVGMPLPGVELRLIGDDGQPAAEGEPGEIQVRGAGVFQEYWRRPEETRAAFADGWFRTGDIAVVEGGRYRILGRASTDIIKTGGYKVSALEIEDALLGHPDVDEVAVVGLSDPEWGEEVAAAVVVRCGAAPTAEGLRAWAKERLAAYKVPRRYRIVDALPRNAMGKVTKPAVSAMFAGSS